MLLKKVNINFWKDEFPISKLCKIIQAFSVTLENKNQNNFIKYSGRYGRIFDFKSL